MTTDCFDWRWPSSTGVHRSRPSQRYAVACPDAVAPHHHPHRVPVPSPTRIRSSDPDDTTISSTSGPRWVMSSLSGALPVTIDCNMVRSVLLSHKPKVGERQVQQKRQSASGVGGARHTLSLLAGPDIGSGAVCVQTPRTVQESQGPTRMY